MSQDALYFNVWFSACYMRLRERLFPYGLDENAFHDTYLLVREKALCSGGGIADFEAYFRACYRLLVQYAGTTPSWAARKMKAVVQAVRANRCFARRSRMPAAAESPYAGYTG